MLKKKTHTTTVLASFLVFFIGVCGGMFLFHDDIMSFIFGKKQNEEMNLNHYSDDAVDTMLPIDAEGYETIDSCLNSVLSSEEYDESTLNTKRELVLQALNSSECENYIKSDSIKTDDCDYITFNFLNGTECIVELNEEREYGTIGGMPSYSDYWVKNDEGVLKSAGKIERIPWQIADMKSPYNESDKKALLIDGAGITDVSYNLTENEKEWSKCHLKTTHEYNFTVADFSTKLSDYDYVNIYCHGAFVDNIPRILTDEELSVEKNIEYATDMTSGRVSLIYSIKNEGYVINPVFFKYYYHGNKLNNTIVWLSSCYAFTNNKLAEAFKDAGVKFLIGADGINNTGYDQPLQIYFMYNLFIGKEAYEALTLAKDVCEEQWKKCMNGVNIKSYTTDRVYLFTLKDEAKEKWNRASNSDIIPVVGYVTDLSGNPIEGANVCPKYNINGKWQAADNIFTDEEGRYSFELKNNTYKIFINADGYVDYESKEYEIETTMDAEGNRFEYIIDTIKLEKKLVVPNIVQTVFENTELWHKETVDNSPYYDEREEYFWFQDIDMDGTVEFITGPAISGAHSCHRFCIWKVENDQLQKVSYIYNSDYQENALMLWHNYSELIDIDRPSPIDSFMLKLFKNTENGHFEYIYTTQDGDASGSVASIYEFDCNKKETKEIFSIGIGPNFTEYLVNANVVLEGDFKAEYNRYISKLQLYDTSVIKLNYYDYSAMSDEQKKDMLLTSYNAWQYFESDKSINLGMNSVVADIKNSSSSSNNESDTSGNSNINFSSSSNYELSNYLGKDISICYDIFGKNSIKHTKLIDGSISKDNFDMCINGVFIGNISVDDKNKITMIAVNSSEYSIYGINVGETISSAISKLENIGIKVESNFIYDYDDDGIMNHCHLNNSDYIKLDGDKGIVQSIMVISE